MPTIAPLSYAALPWRVVREGLDELFWNTVKSVDSKLPLAYTVLRSNRSYEERYSFAGTTNFSVWPDGQPLTYEAIEPRYLSTFTHVDYAKGIRFTRKARREAKYNLIQDAVQQLAISAMNTREMQAASLINNGFTTVWNATEGQYLFSTSHPLSPRSSVTTASNLVTGALSLTTLEQAVTLLRKTPDDLGRPMNIRPVRLWVPPDLEWTARRLIQSPDDPSTANRAVNPLFREQIEIVVWPYLTSSTAWFLQGDYTKTIWYDREPLRTDANETDFDTEDAKYKAAYVCSYGAADWRGWVGSTGL